MNLYETGSFMNLYETGSYFYDEMQFLLQARHVILLLCQFVNYLEATWLPVYYPSQQEKDDPRLYAENIRRLMAHEVCIQF